MERRPVPPRSAKEIEADLDTLARTIYGEARGQILQGQVAVGWVVRNRALRPRRFGASIKEVCLKPKQFSCWNEDDPNRKLVLAADHTKRSFLGALGVAALVMSGDFPDPTGGADHYFTVEAPPGAVHWPPKWSAEMRETVVIGAHRFFKE